MKNEGHFKPGVADIDARGKFIRFKCRRTLDIEHLKTPRQTLERTIGSSRS